LAGGAKRFYKTAGAGQRYPFQNLISSLPAVCQVIERVTLQMYLK
jgi:hypothetical protein